MLILFSQHSFCTTLVSKRIDLFDNSNPPILIHYHILNTVLRYCKSSSGVHGFTETIYWSLTRQKQASFVKITMCTQVWIKYQCGCKKKGKFLQCDCLYNQQLNVWCDTLDMDEIVSWNYYITHLSREGKAMMVYQGQRPQWVIRDPDIPKRDDEGGSERGETGVWYFI